MWRSQADRLSGQRDELVPQQGPESGKTLAIFLLRMTAPSVYILMRWHGVAACLLYGLVCKFLTLWSEEAGGRSKQERQHDNASVSNPRSLIMMYPRTEVVNCKSEGGSTATLSLVLASASDDSSSPCKGHVHFTYECVYNLLLPFLLEARYLITDAASSAAHSYEQWPLSQMSSLGIGFLVQALYYLQGQSYLSTETIMHCAIHSMPICTLSIAYDVSSQ